jgi:hypothetical protein
MKKYIVLVVPFMLLLSACSETATTQPHPTATPTEAVPEELSESAAAPSLVSGDIADYLPAIDDFQEPFVLSGFPATNESLVENWGAEYETIFVETGRQEGQIGLYDLEPTDLVAPPRLLIVIERFNSVEGAAAFFSYDFPGAFRGGIYDGETIELGAADQAMLAKIENPNGDDPNEVKMTIVFQYRNVNVIVEGQGTVDNVYQYYLERIALSILEKLEMGS